MKVMNKLSFFYYFIFIFRSLVAWFIYLSGLAYPLTPSDSPPTWLDFLIFLGIPIFILGIPCFWWIYQKIKKQSTKGYIIRIAELLQILLILGSYFGYFY